MSIENVNDLVVRGKAKLVPAAVQEALDTARAQFKKKNNVVRFKF